MSDPKMMVENDAFHRLTARLALLDLDPATLEMLTAVLTVDLDVPAHEAEAPVAS